MSTKILDLLAQLEAQIDNSPRPRIGGGNKRTVDVEPLRDIFSDLRVTIPDEIRWAQSVLNERDDILETAKKQAETIVLEARQQREKLLDESNITREANRRAEELLRHARENAELVTSGARSYTDDILFDLQRYLREYIDIIDHNREELHQAYSPDAQAEPAKEAAEPAGEEASVPQEPQEQDVFAAQEAEEE